MTAERPDIHHMVGELTRQHTHVQIFDHDDTGTSIHSSLAPALLDQLNNAHSTANGENGAGGYKSRPAAWLEPLDTLVLIDKEASAWVRDLGEDDPVSTKACVLKLHGLWASADHTQQKAIEHDVRRWWSQARVVTGWDSVAWRPDNTCPMCNERRTLRIKLGDQIGFCTECRETWQPDNIGLLAEHIRAENQDGTTNEGDAA